MQLIIVSGGSLSGKTTLARALAETLGDPWLHIEADRFVPHVPSMSDPGATWGADRQRRFVLALHRAAVQWVDSGFSVVLDGALPYPPGPMLEDCLHLLAPYRPFFIGVTTSISSLSTRAAGRPGADLAWARRQNADVNDALPSDVEVDTSQSSTEDCVEIIRRHLPVATDDR